MLVEGRYLRRSYPPHYHVSTATLLFSRRPIQPSPMQAHRTRDGSSPTSMPWTIFWKARTRNKLGLEQQIHINSYRNTGPIYMAIHMRNERFVLEWDLHHMAWRCLVEYDQKEISRIWSQTEVVSHELVAATLADFFDLSRLPQPHPLFRRSFHWVVTVLLDTGKPKNTFGEICDTIINLMENVKVFQKKHLCENREMRPRWREWLRSIGRWPRISLSFLVKWVLRMGLEISSMDTMLLFTHCVRPSSVFLQIHFRHIIYITTSAICRRSLWLCSSAI